MYFFTTVAKLLGSWQLGSGEIWYEITLSDWFRFPDVGLASRPLALLALCPWLTGA